MTLYGIFILLLLITLVALLGPVSQANALPKRQRAYFFAITVLIFFFGGFGLYGLLGTPQIVPLLALREQKLAELKKAILQNSETVKHDATDLRAWVNLGQAFLETSQYSAAANAFKQAVLLSNGNPALVMAYAKSTILTANGAVSDDAEKSLDIVLLQDPANAEARYYLAVRHLQDGKTKLAMEEMQSLYHSLPDNSSIKQMINQQIGRK